MNDTILTRSQMMRSFKLTQLAPSVIICESPDDIYNWGNESNDAPAFLAYLGCRKDEVAGYIKTFNTFYRCDWCEVRKPKHLKDFEAEIKIRGMQRETDSYAFGLDYLVESQRAKYGEPDFDELNYLTTGYLPQW